jgi:hypothetical protein
MIYDTLTSLSKNFGFTIDKKSFLGEASIRKRDVGGKNKISRNISKLGPPHGKQIGQKRIQWCGRFTLRNQNKEATAIPPPGHRYL